ncbi:MAG TPA: hypothetical protein VFQ05_16510 [Candidatus Eisenbacteria bacterium]|nr:hypothetical protein [Candidatus Eisenbacteria bacterium]
MNTVNNWWANMPNERFWLVVARPDEMKDVLVIPEESSQDVAAWVNQLPAYIPRRDVVFQYDSESRGIVAWSRARGPGARQEPGRSNGHSHRASWLVKVHGWRLLHTPVSIDEIAREQYDFFPALRTLEEEVGDPLYYPFAMGSPTETHPLPGKLFKLPAMFVEQFSPLTAVADETRTAEHGANLRQRTASWWGTLEDFMQDRPRTARAR